MKDIEQISMFGFVDEYETEQLPPEKRKKGVKAWTIEAMPGAVNSWEEPIRYWLVWPRRIIFERDSEWDDHYQCWDTFGHSLGGRYFGFYGGHGKMPVFRKRPSWQDCCAYVRKQKEFQSWMRIDYYDKRPE